jgi:hypothetical protein
VWNVDHAACWRPFSNLSVNGAGLQTDGHQDTWLLTPPDATIDDAKLAQRRSKRRSLKERLVRCGPVATNMSYASHFVLLYGYRGSFMYILDPGMVIYNGWVKTHPSFSAPATTKQDYTLYDPQTQMPVFTAFAGAAAFGCHLAIDAEYTFPNVVVGRDQVTKEIIHGAVAFIDSITLGVGFCFDKNNRFTEFLTAAAPDGRLPANGSVAPPTPTPTPSTPSPPPSNPSSPASDPSPPPSVPPASASGNDEPWYDEFVDWLLGRSQAQPAPTPGPTQAPTGGPASATVSVVDDSGAALAGAQVEIVGIDMGKTPKSGQWASRNFDPGTYNLKVRMTDYGPLVAPKMPSRAGEHAESLTFAGGPENISVTMVNLKNARAFVWVLEYGSNKPLSAAQVEIVGQYMDSADSDGKVVSCAMKPAKYHLKTRLDGYGPAFESPVSAGETDRVVQLRKGDQAFVVYMANAAPVSVPPPDDESVDHSQLQIIAPQTSVEYPLIQPITFQYTSSTWNVESKWTLFAPDGTVIDTSRDVGGGTYTLNPSVLDGYQSSNGNGVYGPWTLRYEKDKYYDDCQIMVWSPLPDTGVPVTAAPPSNPSPAPVPSVPSAGGGGTLYTSDPNEVPTQSTLLTAQQIVQLAQAAWPSLNDTGTRMLAAQWATETKQGTHCYNYNFGNVKGSKGQLHMYLRGTWELYKTQDAAQAAVDASNGNAHLATDAERQAKGEPPDAPMVCFDPPSPVARFRAFPSAQEGMASWVAMKQRIDAKYGGYLDALNSGDAPTMAHILIAEAKYATAKESTYRDGLIKNKVWVDQQLAGGGS